MFKNYVSADVFALRQLVRAFFAIEGAKRISKKYNFGVMEKISRE